MPLNGHFNHRVSTRQILFFLSFVSCMLHGLISFICWNWTSICAWLFGDARIGFFICLFLSVNPSADALMPSCCTVLQGIISCAWNWLAQGHPSTTASTPTHLNSSGQAVRLPFDQWLHSSILRGEDRERHQHIIHSIYTPSMSALFFIHSENTVLLMAPQQDASRQRGQLESWVSSLWPDKSSIERCVMRAAEMASAPGERATMENGNWTHARTSKDEGWDSIKAASEPNERMVLWYAVK